MFSPFWPSSTSTLCCATFDLAPLLRESVECEGTEEDEHAYASHTRESSPAGTSEEPPVLDVSGVDDLPLIDATGVDEFSPSSSPRPRKRVRLEDIPKRNGHRHAKRQKQRDAAHARTGHVAQQATLLAQVAANRAANTTIHATLDATDLPAARGGYSAKGGKARGDKKRRSLAEITRFWDIF